MPNYEAEINELVAREVLYRLKEGMTIHRGVLIDVVAHDLKERHGGGIIEYIEIVNRYFRSLE
jgi:hypothetical protein